MGIRGIKMRVMLDEITMVMIAKISEMMLTCSKAMMVRNMKPFFCGATIFYVFINSGIRDTFGSQYCSYYPIKLYE